MHAKPRLIDFFRKTGFFWLVFVAVFGVMFFQFRSEFPRPYLLCKWDCGWYQSIARNGYISTIPPGYQDGEHSNVAFFPAYPTLGYLLSKLTGLELKNAFPLLSMLCAFLLSFVLWGILEKEKLQSRLWRYAILLVYPTTFYLFVGYSEALYLVSLFGVCSILLHRNADRLLTRKTTAFLVLSGFLLGATRLTGFVIPAFLFLAALVFEYPKWNRRILTRVSPGAVGLFSACAGIGTFFLFCAWKFGHWNLYFWQLKIGWYKTFSPMAALGIAIHSLKPWSPDWNMEHFLADTRAASQAIADTLLVVSLYAFFRSIPSVIRFHRERRWGDFARCFLVWAGLTHLLIVLCGDVGPWDQWGNGMRYSMPTLYLLVVSWRDEWTPAFLKKRPASIIVGVLFAFLLFRAYEMQLKYIARFIRSEWVS